MKNLTIQEAREIIQRLEKLKVKSKGSIIPSIDKKIQSYQEWIYKAQHG